MRCVAFSEAPGLCVRPRCLSMLGLQAIFFLLSPLVSVVVPLSYRQLNESIGAQTFDWIVFPLETISIRDEARAVQRINSIVGQNNVNVTRSGLSNRVAYWLVVASPSQVQTINRIEYVRNQALLRDQEAYIQLQVYPAERNERMIVDSSDADATNGAQPASTVNVTDADSATTPLNGTWNGNFYVEAQYDAPPDLVAVSWPRDKDIVPVFPPRQYAFVYEGPALRPVDVFVLDQGVNIHHMVFAEALHGIAEAKVQCRISGIFPIKSSPHKEAYPSRRIPRDMVRAFQARL